MRFCALLSDPWGCNADHHRAHPYHLPQIARDEMHHLGRHRVHPDDHTDRIAASDGSEGVGDKIATGEGLCHTGQQTGRCIGIDLKTNNGGHGPKTPDTKTEKAGLARLLRQPGR